MVPVLAGISGTIPTEGRTDTKLCESLYTYFNRYIYDLEHGIPQHECTRPECRTYCILPIFARRVFPDSKVDELFQTLQNIIANDPSIIDLSPLERGNESENAKRILQYIAYLRVPSRKDAMGGHHGTVFDPYRLVDSRLYELLFDLFRSYDYRREARLWGSRDCSGVVREWSTPLIDTRSSEILAGDISRIDRPTSILQGSNSLRSNVSIPFYSRTGVVRSSGAGTHRDAPPSYHSLSFDYSVIPSTPVNLTVSPEIGTTVVAVPKMPPSYIFLQHDTNTGVRSTPTINDPVGSTRRRTTNL